MNKQLNKKRAWIFSKLFFEYRKLYFLRNLVRGELTRATIERNLGSIQGWQSSLDRMIQNDEAERLDPETLEKNKAALQQAKESIQTLEETKRIRPLY